MTLKDLNDADELYARIHELNYKQFARAPGFEERTLAIQHNEGDQDMYVDIYMNEVLEKVLEANEPYRLSKYPEKMFRNALGVSPQERTMCADTHYL